MTTVMERPVGGAHRADLLSDLSFVDLRRLVAELEDELATARALMAEAALMGLGRARRPPQRAPQPAPQPALQPVPDAVEEAYLVDTSDDDLPQESCRVRRAPEVDLLLTAEEEVELAQRVQAGDAEAFERFVLANRRLVVAYVRRHGAPGLEFEDQVNNGILGMMRAVQLFDPTRGNKFSTYATWWIRQSVSRALDDHCRTIRYPVHVSDQMSAAHACGDREEMARFAALPRVVMSTDDLAELEADGEAVLPDLLVPDELPDRVCDREFVAHLLACLTEREREVIVRRTGLLDGEQHTLDAIGQDFGLTRERIRQIESKAMKKLRCYAGVGE